MACTCQATADLFADARVVQHGRRPDRVIQSLVRAGSLAETDAGDASLRES